MIRRILLAAAGLFAAVCVACAPSLVPPPSFMPHPPIKHAFPTGCAMANVRVLSGPPWVNLDDPTQDPSALSSLPSPADYIVRDLENAFDLAPPFFQDQLCKLDGIYIVDDGGPWAFRNIDPFNLTASANCQL
jgi:hypothetical protein